MTLHFRSALQRTNCLSEHAIWVFFGYLDTLFVCLLVPSTGCIRNANAWYLPSRNCQAIWKARYVEGSSYNCCTGTYTRYLPLKNIRPSVLFIITRRFSSSKVDCRLLDGRVWLFFILFFFTSHRNLYSIEWILSITIYRGLSLD